MRDGRRFTSVGTETMSAAVSFPPRPVCRTVLPTGSRYSTRRPPSFWDEKPWLTLMAMSQRKKADGYLHRPENGTAIVCVIAVPVLAPPHPLRTIDSCWWGCHAATTATRPSFCLSLLCVFLRRPWLDRFARQSAFAIADTYDERQQQRASAWRLFTDDSDRKFVADATLQEPWGLGFR